MSEGPRPSSEPNHLQKRLDHLVGTARLALWWEEAWPRLWLPLSVVAAFLTVSFFGLWIETPPLWHAVGLALFALALAVAFWPVLRISKPRRAQALDRLDRDAGAAHGPARALDDTLALGSGDPGTRALWDLHRRRAETALGSMRVTPPRPDMPRRDRYAVRAAGLLAVAASAFVAGPEAWPRLAAAFDWRTAPAAAPAFRVDGWIDPPLYTRTPPLMIDLAAGEQHLRAPVKSTVVVRAAGQGDATITALRGLTALPAQPNQRADLHEERFTLDGDAELSVRTGLASGVKLTLEAIPDTPPVIAFSAPPEVNARGTFNLAYKGSDDYGITGIEGSVEKADASRGRRSLVPAPTLALALPADGNAETKSPVDLTNHPWAGARVKMKLIVKDEAGQQGATEIVEMTLPQRPFTNPLAKALVEQRRNLVLNPDDRKRTQTALDALLIAPDLYTPQWGVFMGLRLGTDRLRRARSDQDLTEVADWLWTMALQIEDGNLSDAERQLRAAQDRLKEAMDRGASDEEIRRLTDELRLAMDKFLREFAQRMQQNQQSQNQAQNQRSPDRMVSQDDLNRMLQQMEDAMRRGDMAEAERLLNQLRSILENLQMAQPNSRMSDPLGQEMNQAMQDLENMAREQQQLRDETFQEGQNRRMRQGERGRQQPGQRGQNQRGQRQPGQQGEPGEQGDGQEQAENGQGGGQQDPLGLGQRQQALRDRLRQLQDKMRGMGMQNEGGLGDAEQAMREAENAIGQGQDGPAVDAQGRALENLRRGMQGMAQQMQQMQQGDG
ncbi:MAG: TIGR02302 family protein, partial [Microvirga sp.]